MGKGPSVVNLVSIPLGVGTCELCGREGLSRPGRVVVHLATGAAVEFAACAACITALQQLGLDSGGLVRFASGEAPATIPPAGAIVLEPVGSEPTELGREDRPEAGPGAVA